MAKKPPPSQGTGFKPPVNKTGAKNPSAEVDSTNIVPITLDRLTAKQRDELEQMMSNVKGKFMDSFQETRDKGDIPQDGTVEDLGADGNQVPLQFNNFQDRIDYAVQHALINQFGVLVNILTNMVKTVVDSSIAEHQASGPVYLPGDSQLADLAFQGLIAPIKEKFSAQDFESLSHLAQKVTLHEQRFAEAKKNFKKINHVYPYMYDSDDEDDDFEVAAAEWVKSEKVIPCQWVKSSGKEERFDFDITKADKIFDVLLWKKQIQLPAGHLIPSAEELGKRRYCKWHNSGSHSTNGCKVFRQQVQAAIEGGKIKFDDSKKPMKVDGNPFPVNMVHTSGRTADGGE
uniref:Retrotransposon protein, putative, unclassified n=1 Tax=Oryza sativa subsp. japonica TaxID=39947 RepID=Q2QVZ8_ORYSJ|nr:retrotransposon protein, putative, unclassified [Oryza sativa Japonica Group]